MKFFQNLPKKAPKSGLFGQKSGGLFEFCIGGGLIKSGGLLARIRYWICILKTYEDKPHGQKLNKFCNYKKFFERSPSLKKIHSALTVNK